MFQHGSTFCFIIEVINFCSKLIISLVRIFVSKLKPLEVTLCAQGQTAV